MSTTAMTITLIILLGLGIAGLLAASKYLMSIYLYRGKHSTDTFRIDHERIDE